MEIKSIKMKKNNPNMFVVTTDRGEFELYADIIVKNKLSVGEIDAGEFFDSVRESNIIIGENQCVKFLSNRLKTKKQIKDYLYQKSYKTDVVNAVIAKLESYGIIDDRAYVRAYIKSNPNFSKLKLTQKLSSFGVGKNLIDSELEDIDDLDTCVKNLEKLTRNKILTPDGTKKVIRRLQSMGYNWEKIRSAANQLGIDLETKISENQ